VYEQHWEECIRAAAETDDPKQRVMLLKLASECARIQEYARARAANRSTMSR
jgi:hypothetical protein